MTKFIKIFFLLFLPLNVIASELTDSIYDADPYFILVGEAENAIANENWEEAIARLNDAIHIMPNHPTNALLYSNLASVYTFTGQDSLALVSYDHALDIAPSMVVIHIGKGRLLLKNGHDFDAYNSFSRAIEIDSISTTARYYRGMMALYGGNKEIAETDFEVLRRISPKSIDTAIALGTLYSLTGRERDAIPYLKTLIEHEPSPEYYASLAGCYLELEELSSASEVIHDGMNLYPNDPELYYYRAWLNRERYLLDDAKKDAYRAIELGASPTKVNALFEK